MSGKDTLRQLLSSSSAPARLFINLLGILLVWTSASHCLFLEDLKRVPAQHPKVAGSIPKLAPGDHFGLPTKDLLGRVVPIDRPVLIVLMPSCTRCSIKQLDLSLVTGFPNVAYVFPDPEKDIKTDVRKRYRGYLLSMTQITVPDNAWLATPRGYLCVGGSLVREVEVGQDDAGGSVSL